METRDLLWASFQGFNCDQCNKKVSGRWPVRQYDDGPYFCSFLCGLDYRAQRGDQGAMNKAEEMRNIFSKYAIAK
jgi:hypothetical protein